MAPLRRSWINMHAQPRRANPTYGDWRATADKEALIVEGWSEGFLVGSLLVMALITIANMRKGVLLHKLILLELLLAIFHGTFGFMGWKGYGWYLSTTAALLYCSYLTHNIISWLKIRPFFYGSRATFKPLTCRLVPWIYLTTLALTIPALVFGMFNNFRYFNNISTLFIRLRPYEPLLRDPWWIFSCSVLFYVVQHYYGLGTGRLISESPRFGILLVSITLAVIFTSCDVIFTIKPDLSSTNGINPYWKLALVFKCLTDNIILDDFSTTLRGLATGSLGRCATTFDSLHGTTDNPEADRGRSDVQCCQDICTPQHSASCSNTRARSHDSWSFVGHSGRQLDVYEALRETGPSRRRQSMSQSEVGKLPCKLRNLGDIRSICASTDQRMETNTCGTFTAFNTEIRSVAGASSPAQEGKEDVYILRSACGSDQSI